jgi:hypothetical protein
MAGRGVGEKGEGERQGVHGRTAGYVGCDR